MIREDRCIILDNIDLSPDALALREQYLELSKLKKVGENHTRLEDFRRWDIVNQLLGDVSCHLDIGAGVGQFPNLLARKCGADRVSACDVTANWRMQNLTGFSYFIHDLRIPFSQRWSTVTCLEVIEHIEEGFEVAVENLKNLATEKLIVTIPYCERLPLSTGHVQQFTKERIESLFPGGDIYFCLNGNLCQWALVKYTK